MRPLRLIMQAFGSYGQKTTVDFTKPDQNLFLITGDTGAGKSTIFDAIVFALYGEASSSVNKKEGVVLQSQYVDYGIEPFVELEFLEENGGADAAFLADAAPVYTVRRVPRHLKPITRGADKGNRTREISGSVTLTMPDGTEYPQKETDARLQDLVGLTKSQFMQVAMIAQGEFMDLLRAKSDDKKVIFRRLFGTEKYQRIVEELANRKRGQEAEIARIKTQCQSDAARVKIPEEYDGAERIAGLKKQLLDGEIVVLDEFMAELELMCQYIKVQQKQAEKKCETVQGAHNKKREELAKAEERLKQFREIYKKIDRAKKETEEKTDAREKAVRRFGEANEKQKRLEQQEQNWKEQSEALADADVLLEKAESKAREADRMQEDYKALQNAEKAAEDCRARAESLKKKYRTVSADYTGRNQKYEELRRIFLDSQAGFLAKRLIPGEPCPVCGSCEHPFPCPPLDGYENLSREQLDRMAKEVEKLRAQQEKLSAEIKSKTDLYEEKGRACQEQICKLRQTMKEQIPGFSAEDSGSSDDLRREISAWSGLVQKERKTCADRVAERQKLQKKLADLQKQKEQAGLLLENAREAVNAADKDLSAACAALKTLEQEAERRQNSRQDEAEMNSLLERLGGEVREAEGILKKQEQIRDRWKVMYREDSEVYNLLTQKAGQRGTLIEAHARLDNLYRLASGNVKGSRMDLETYVQRYYLEQILRAANRRFQDMSAGQFELRMYDLTKAGEGKNRGLDLMVYSTVTGKEREVRTLSGGESFMAALSLALGMADQIQESSAAISLDMMFIDEGFGSLDEHSRSQAVKVLLEMAEGSRLIGIISHVTELKQEIEDQLIVRKDETGSHVRWQIS